MGRGSASRIIGSAGLLAIIAATTNPTITVFAANPITVNFSSSSPGQQFEGVGVESAAAVTRLFYDYTAQYQGSRNVQQEVLDAMFCNPNAPPGDPAHYCLAQSDGYPAYAGSYQVLKVEIGGDTNSSVGSEASYLRTLSEYNAITAPNGLTTANCHINRPYEWWLMREAKARNPEIQMGGLVIGAPGYLTSPSGDFFSLPNNPHTDLFHPANSVAYYTLYAECASLQGTPLSFVGVLNESSRWGYEFTKQWIEDLRVALDDAYSAGKVALPVRIVCCDNGWSPTDNTGATLEQDISSDPTFANALGVIAVHYPDERINPPPQPLPSGKPIWASEDAPGIGSAGEGDWPIAKNIVKLINQHHLQAQTTRDIFVTPVDAYNDAIALPDSGLAKAATPWSSNYNIQAATWLVAQITEATQPGWIYVDQGSCFIGASSCSDPTNNVGSYVTWRNPVANGDWTTVAETMGATSPVDFKLCPAVGDPNLNEPSLLNIAFSNQSDYFDGLPSLQKDGQGCYSTTLQPETIYTFTTLGPPYGPHHGAGLDSPPPSAPLSFPYHESFDSLPTDSVNSGNCNHPSYAVGDIPCWTSDLEGAFEVKGCAAPKTDKCLEQVVSSPTIYWQPGMSYGYTTVMGDRTWTNYDVSAQYLLKASGTARLMGRVSPVCEGVQSIQCGTVMPKSYALNISSSGACEVDKGLVDPINLTVSYQLMFSCGTVAFGTNTWHTLGIRVQDNAQGVPQVTAYFDGTSVGSGADTDTVTAIHSGAVAFGTADLTDVQIDEVCVSNPGDGVCLPA